MSDDFAWRAAFNAAMKRGDKFEDQLEAVKVELTELRAAVVALVESDEGWTYEHKECGVVVQCNKVATKAFDRLEALVKEHIQ